MSVENFSLTVANGRAAVQATAEGHLSLLIDAKSIFTLVADNDEYIADKPLPETLAPEALLAVLAHYFSYRAEQKNIALIVQCTAAWAASAQRAGVIDSFSARGDGRFSLHAGSETFWQNPLPWLRDYGNSSTPLRYAITNGKRHPQRASKASGEVYRRYIPSLNSSFSLRALNIDTDLPLFNEWQNRENVALFWETRGTLEEHKKYLQDLHDDPHTQTLMGCFDDEPFAYFEMYWAREDRIAPFYDVHDYDRGAHTLIGNRRFQTPLRLKTWLCCLLHYLFLDDVRTQRIVGEPRIDNDRHIANLQRAGMAKLKEFDFPHKRAALMLVDREVFFGQSSLWD